jgi:hypothetical protein
MPAFAGMTTEPRLRRRHDPERRRSRARLHGADPAHHVGDRTHVPVLMRLFHHVGFPQVPGAGRVAGISVAQRAFTGRDVIDRSPERERDRLHAGVLVGEYGARGRDPDIQPDHDIAVAAHQRDRLVAKGRGQ